MHNRLGLPAVISDDLEMISKAKKLILPGVGHFDHGIEQLTATGIKEVINTKVLVEKTPILGICLGAQLMTKSSEEGGVSGLGWIDAETVRFHFKNGKSHLKIPHMGWTDILPIKKSNLIQDLPEEPRYYFVHAYHFKLKDVSSILTNSTYGYEFVSGFEKDNIYGVQFHPEKSHKFGMKLLQNFAAL